MTSLLWHINLPNRQCQALCTLFKISKCITSNDGLLAVQSPGQHNVENLTDIVLFYFMQNAENKNTVVKIGKIIGFRSRLIGNQNNTSNYRKTGMDVVQMQIYGK